MGWKEFWQYLLAFVPAAVKSWFAERKRQQVIADSGAANQRAADAEAQGQINAEAEGRKNEVGNLPQPDLDRRIDHWRGVRPPR